MTEQDLTTILKLYAELN